MDYFRKFKLVKKELVTKETWVLRFGFRNPESVFAGKVG